MIQGIGIEGVDPVTRCIELQGAVNTYNSTAAQYVDPDTIGTLYFNPGNAIRRVDNQAAIGGLGSAARVTAACQSGFVDYTGASHYSGLITAAITTGRAIQIDHVDYRGKVRHFRWRRLGSIEQYIGVRIGKLGAALQPCSGEADHRIKLTANLAQQDKGVTAACATCSTTCTWPCCGCFACQSWVDTGFDGRLQLFDIG